MAEDGSDVTQHTFHKGWDVQSPALHDGKIVYQLGADLHLFDNLTNTEKKIDISLASDFDQTREKWIKKPMDYLSDIHISEEGKKIALTSRGRIFVAPVKELNSQQTPKFFVTKARPRRMVKSLHSRIRIRNFGFMISLAKRLR